MVWCGLGRTTPLTAFYEKKATAHMSIRRHLASWATATVALLAFSGTVNASVPPAPPTTAPATAAGTGDPVVEESWALAPAGSLDPSQAGNRPELTYVSDRGATIEDAVTLYNYGTVQLTFRLYATDAYNGNAGAFQVLAADQQPTVAGTWVTLAQDLITVPAGKQATIPITIHVPADIAPGDYAGAIMASSPTMGVGEQGQTITLDRRTGTRLYLRVNGDLFPELGVSNVDTTYHHSLNPFGGSTHVTFTVVNRGNVRLGGTATVSVAGPFGIGERKVTLPAFPELLPGQKVELTADLNDVPAGFLDSTTVEIAPTGAEGLTNLKVTAGDDTTFAPPLGLLFLALFLILVLLVLRVRSHRTAALQGAGSATGDREPHLV